MLISSAHTHTHRHTRATDYLIAVGTTVIINICAQALTLPDIIWLQAQRVDDGRVKLGWAGPKLSGGYGHYEVHDIDVSQQG